MRVPSPVRIAPVLLGAALAIGCTGTGAEPAGESTARAAGAAAAAPPESAAAAAAPAAAAEPAPAGAVEFVDDAVRAVDGAIMKLANGSDWRLEHPALLTPGRKVVIVTLPGLGSGHLYVKGAKVRVDLIRGVPARKRGRLGLVVRALGEGGLLELDDRSLWQVPARDRAATQRWLPPYPAIVTSDRRCLYNLDEGERVWVSPTR